MWYRIIEWFGEVKERYGLISDFNRAAKSSFIKGTAPTLLNAKITIGSNRIKALSGEPLNKNELIEIGKVVLDNEELVRKLISLGWDTLEVQDVKGFHGVKWALKKYAKIGGLLE